MAVVAGWATESVVDSGDALANGLSLASGQMIRNEAMRGSDDETGEFLSPSRSQQRREALDVLALGEKLVALTEAQLAKLPMPEDLLPHIRETRSASPRTSRTSGSWQFLAKQMRREDDETLDAIRDALDENGEAARREVARDASRRSLARPPDRRRRRRAGRVARRVSRSRPPAPAPAGAQCDRGTQSQQAAARVPRDCSGELREADARSSRREDDDA